MDGPLLQMTGGESGEDGRHLLAQPMFLLSYYVFFSATEVSDHHPKSQGASSVEAVDPHLHVPGWTATSPGQTLWPADPTWPTPSALAGVPACEKRLAVSCPRDLLEQRGQCLQYWVFKFMLTTKYQLTWKRLITSALHLGEPQVSIRYKD